MAAACLSCPEALEVEVRSVGAVVAVVCRGALVAGSDAHRVLVEAARHLRAGEPVAIDLRAVDRLDAHGIGVLAAVASEALRAGRRATVIGPTPRVARLLRLCGVAASVDGVDDDGR